MVERDLLTGELILDRTERLNVGKYKGRTVSSVMITDPQYLVWLLTTENGKYALSDTWRQKVEDYAYAQSRRRECSYVR